MFTPFSIRGLSALLFAAVLLLGLFVTVNGVANTLRPDVTGPINIIGSVDRWFDISVF